MEEKQFKDLKISSSDQVKSKVEPEEIEGIDLEKMKQTGEYFFRFFKQYDHKLDLEKAKKIMWGKAPKRTQAVKVDHNRESLKPSEEAISKEVVVQIFEDLYIKDMAIKSLRKNKEKITNEIKSLARFYRSFIQTLEL